MIWVYRILFFPALLFMLPYYLLRMWRRGGYGHGFSQRFGTVPISCPPRPNARRVWLQAVSVGEMQAIAPLLQSLKQRGDIEVYLTTTTSTGYRIASERYGPASGLTVGVGYFPLDWWAFSARAWRRVRPDLVILMEGERWPEHIAQARKRGVPVLAVNARLSDRSFSRMRAWRRVAMPLMQRGITRMLACSEQDAARFLELGFAPDQVLVTGNIKWDVTIPSMGGTERATLLAELGLGGMRNAERGMPNDQANAGQAAQAHRPQQAHRTDALANDLIFLGSSTWPGEEEACIAALLAARAAGVAARLLLVPRHMERRDDVETLLQKISADSCAAGASLTWHFRSRGAASGPVDIAVGDTTGELRKFTQLADLVFVGKSLPPHTEGQTPVEAAALGRPILFGPGMSNFRQISKVLTRGGAALVVQNRDELNATVVRILGGTAERAKMTSSAQACHRANQGAVARTFGVIEKILDAAKTDGAPNDAARQSGSHA